MLQWWRLSRILHRLGALPPPAAGCNVGRLCFGRGCEAPLRVAVPFCPCWGRSAGQPGAGSLLPNREPLPEPHCPSEVFLGTIPWQRCVCLGKATGNPCLVFCWACLSFRPKQAPLSLLFYLCEILLCNYFIFNYFNLFYILCFNLILFILFLKFKKLFYFYFLFLFYLFLIELNLF